MNVKIILRLLAVIASSYALNATALDVKEYKNMKEQKSKELCYYLFGMSSGFDWAETMELKGNEKRSKFCVENQIKLNCANYIDLLDQYIKETKGTSLAVLVADDQPIEPSLYSVLRKVYSCKK